MREHIQYRAMSFRRSVKENVRMQVSYIPVDGWASVPGYGAWCNLPKAHIPGNHWVGVTVKASSEDRRLRRWIVAIVHHDRDLQRQGSKSLVLGSNAFPQAHRWTTLYVSEEQKGVGRMDKRKKYDEFWDLATGIDAHERIRLKGLYTCEKMTKQIGRGNQSFKYRNKDLELVAKERCKCEAPTELENYLAGKDYEYDIIAGHAAERIQLLLRAKDHYAKKQTTGKENGQKKVDEKRKLLNRMQIVHQRGGHQARSWAQYAPHARADERGADG